MKIHNKLILALCFAGIAQAQDHPGSFNFQETRVSEVLKIYSTLVGKELVIEPSATNQWKTITVQTTNGPVSAAVAAKMIETALREQANVAITRLDEKRMSVKLLKK